MTTCPCRDIWLLLLVTAEFSSGQGPAWNAFRLRTANILLTVNTSFSRFNCSRSFLSVGFPHFHYKWDAINFRFNCSRSFLSVGFPHFHYKWDAINFSSPRIQYLAAALGPTSVRIYGTPLLTKKDNRQFEKEKLNLMSENVSYSDHHQPDQILITADNWKKVVSFTRRVGWTLMVDFAAFFHKDGKWISRFARSLLNKASVKKIQIPDFQLGNEPNIYNPRFKINATTVANDFKIFRSWLKKRYPYYRLSKIIGPDVTRLSAVKFLEPFLQANGCDFVDEISFHHYYFKKESTLSTFLDAGMLDNFLKEISTGKKLLKKYNCHKPLRLTETSSSVGGGTSRMSDTYVAGFSWMDKLGQASLLGITKIYRHTFFGSNYALISRNLAPNPDYYLSLMFKRYVEGPVFTVSSRLPRHIRAYANCAREYPPGSLVIYLMNLSEKNEYINLAQFSNDTLSVYTFTAHQGDLQSRKILLNGEPLQMSGGSLPVYKASRHLGEDIMVPHSSYAFVIVTHSKIPSCISYFREKNGRTDDEKVTGRPTDLKPTAHPAVETPGGRGTTTPSGTPFEQNETESGAGANNTGSVTEEVGPGDSESSPDPNPDRPSTPKEDYDDLEVTDKPENNSAFLAPYHPIVILYAALSVTLRIF